jgi:hypothetical protein
VDAAEEARQDYIKILRAIMEKRRGLGEVMEGLTSPPEEQVSQEEESPSPAPAPSGGTQ